jgi:hypothetical protein
MIMAEPSQYWLYFDEAWKKVIERFFPDLLRFFLPALYHDVDFSQPVVFLDKEMEQLAQRSLTGAKYVDKLAQVSLRNGSEQWILVHIEVQGERDEEFSLRMFRYFYRIFDRHGRPIVSVAILAGVERMPGEGRYELKAYGSGVEFQYLTFRLMDYDREKLEADENPIALVALAAQDRERLRRSGDRFNAKRSLVRKLYERGYQREQIVGLFEFMDWVLQLSNEEDKLFWEEVKTLEEEKRMPFMTTPERIGRQQGLEEGLQQGSLTTARETVLEILHEKFGEVPDSISSAIHQIEDREVLRLLSRRVIRCSSFEEFKQTLDEYGRSN